MLVRNLKYVAIAVLLATSANINAKIAPDQYNVGSEVSLAEDG